MAYQKEPTNTESLIAAVETTPTKPLETDDSAVTAGEPQESDFSDIDDAQLAKQLAAAMSRQIPEETKKEHAHGLATGILKTFATVPMTLFDATRKKGGDTLFGLYKKIMPDDWNKLDGIVEKAAHGVVTCLLASQAPAVGYVAIESLLVLNIAAGLGIGRAYLGYQSSGLSEAVIGLIPARQLTKQAIKAAIDNTPLKEDKNLMSVREQLGEKAEPMMDELNRLIGPLSKVLGEVSGSSTKAGMSDEARQQAQQLYAKLLSGDTSGQKELGQRLVNIMKNHTDAGTQKKIGSWLSEKREDGKTNKEALGEFIKKQVATTVEETKAQETTRRSPVPRPDKGTSID